MKILHITSELDGGGVDRLLFDYYNELKGLLQFDFVVTSYKEGMLEKPLMDGGCNVFHISPFRKSLKKHKDELKAILNCGDYDVIHDHSGYKAAINLKLAKQNGIKVRIAHSHQANVKQNFFEKIRRFFFTKMTMHYSTSLVACGKDAAIWMWGRKKFESGEVSLIPNAILTSKFLFSNSIRESIRNELHIENRIVLGNVARFSKQKNHLFLIEMFNYIHKRDDKYCLILVGHGELFQQTKDIVKQLGLEKDVVFLGVRNDVDKLLNAFDVFVLPSLFEGLPVSMVEVQTNGLPAVVSDNVTSEIYINNNVFHLPLEKGAKVWSEFICNNKEICRTQSPDILSSYYNIKIASLFLKEFYENKINKG